MATDLDIDLLRRAFSDRLIGRRIFHYDSLGSTMDEARRRADQGDSEGTVVIAEEQTAARGRFTRDWISPPGQNLLFSVLLRPTAAQLPYLNMAATLAVCSAVAGSAGLSPAIKWPNDVRVDGRKISGILIETAMMPTEVTYAVVGIGVNVNFDPSRFPETASIATSIFKETGRMIDRTLVLRLVLTRFDDLYRSIRGGGLSDEGLERASRNAGALRASAVGGPYPGGPRGVC